MATGRDEYDVAFGVIADEWLRQIECSSKHKARVFGTRAAEIMTFYSGPKNWAEAMSLNTDDDDAVPAPEFGISINKAHEYVSLFGPALYYDNPVRTVKPRMPVEVPADLLQINMADPNSIAGFTQLLYEDQDNTRINGLRAELIGAYLNWTPRETKLSASARDAVNEALIKGRGVLWTELHSPPNSTFKLPRSSFVSVDDIFVDPDAQSLSEAKWIARRCVHPVWEIERLYGLPKGSVKANAESLNRTSDLQDDNEKRSKGESNDLIVYYQIYSKMGIGGRTPDVTKRYGKSFEIFGDYSFIVVAKDHKFLLNLPMHLLDEQYPSKQDMLNDIMGRVAWPTPFWADDGWPFVELDFNKIPKSPWPMAPLAAGLGELKFLNWAYSYLLGHIRTSSRQFIAMLKGLGEDVKSTILNGRDFEAIELDSEYAGKSINELIQFLIHPAMNGDIWKVIEAVERAFDKRVGLSELMYGTTGVQLRSAEEANIKQSNMSVRPEDMANTVEAWMANVSRREAMAARFHLSSDDVNPVLGAVGSYAWTLYCQTRDPQLAARQLEYTIESGSTRRPNKNQEVQQMTEAMQILLPVFQLVMQLTGDPNPLNNLIEDYAKSRDLDPNRYAILNVPPPMPPDQSAGGPEANQQQPTQNPPPTG